MPRSSRDIAALIETVKQAGYRRFRLQQDDFLIELDATGGSPPAIGGTEAAVQAREPVIWLRPER